MLKIRILIIDDSALIRQMLSQILNSSDDLEVVGTAADPIIARKLIKKLNPDLLTLDIEMPRMGGLIFLRNVMRLRPMPVVMISSITEKGAARTLEALEIGAVDFLAKPKIDVVNSLNDYAEDIIAKVKMAAKARVQTLDSIHKQINNQRTAVEKYRDNQTVQPGEAKRSLSKSEIIIAIGSSTGGTEAIKNVVREMPANSPAIVVSQHIPATFSASFAKHVDEITMMTACIAKHGQEILPGNIYIAPGDRHLLVMRDGAGYVCHLNDGPLVNRHKPSVDVMFRSVAKNVGRNAIGVMLTGMGGDGAQAIKEMKQAA